MSKSGRTDNSFTSEYFEAVGRAVCQLDRAMQGYRSLEADVLGLTIRGPQAEGGETLITVRAVLQDGQRVVGFVTASSAADGLKALEGRLEAGQMKWREDQYVR